MAGRASQPLAWIIAFKVVKSLTLVALGVVLLVTRRTIPANDLLGETARWLHVPYTSRLLQRALLNAASLTPQREALVAGTAMAYGGLFATEAVGLAMRVGWARWLTIVATSCLVPLELYELWRHPTFVRASILLVNIGVVVYLVRRKEIFEHRGR
jgi:uncharacterized membrane protein (DUF2068 family)